MLLVLNKLASGESPFQKHRLRNLLESILEGRACTSLCVRPPGRAVVCHPIPPPLPKEAKEGGAGERDRERCAPNC